MTENREQLASIINDQIRLERSCLALLHHVRTSTHLTDLQRDRIDVLINDEVNHSAWLRDRLAVSYTEFANMEPHRSLASYLQELGQMLVDKISPECAVVEMYVPERVGSPCLDWQADLFTQVGDHVTANVYRRIKEEEKLHIRYNGELLQSLMADPEVGETVREYFKKALAAHRSSSRMRGSR
jgi:hypothetical protein